MTTEEELVHYLMDVMFEAQEEEGEECEVKDVETFENALVLTRNKGVVVRMSDGSEFQVTVVRSR